MSKFVNNDLEEKFKQDIQRFDRVGTDRICNHDKTALQLFLLNEMNTVDRLEKEINDMRHRAVAVIVGSQDNNIVIVVPSKYVPGVKPGETALMTLVKP